MPKLSSNAMAKAITDRYVEPTKAAELIGCTDGRIYQMLRAGEFRDVIPNPFAKNRFLISRKECEQLANEPAKTGRPRKNLAAAG